MDSNTATACAAGWPAVRLGRLPSPGGLAAGLAAGILFALQLPALPSLPLLALLAASALPRWPGRCYWAAAVLGLLVVCLRGQALLDARWPAERHGEVHRLTGQVVSLPEPGDRGPGGTTTWRFSFAPQAAGWPSPIRVSWYRSELRPRAGDCWVLDLALRTPRGAANPGASDYEAWLLRAGIAATASVRAAQRCTSHAGLGWLGLRQRLIDDLDAWLPAHPGLAWVAALTVGDDSGLRSADWEALRVTGTTHLIAISGFNVAIVASLAYFIARWAWVLVPAWPRRLPAQKAGWLAAALAGVGYAQLAGWDAPVQRAALMLLVLLVAAWFDRLRRPLHALAVALALMLLWQPFEVLNPGLWLSFGAVAGIFLVTGGRLGARPFWLEALRVQLALSVLLTPLTLYWFGGSAWLAPWINLLAVPVVAVLTPLLLLAVCAAYAVPALGVPLLGLCASAVDELRQGLLWLADALPAPWFAASPDPRLLLLAMFGIVLMLLPRAVPLRVPGTLCVLPLLLPAPGLPAGSLQLSVLDVGQGSAVLVRTAHHSLLYDAGPAWDEGFDAGDAVVVPYLLRSGLRRLDVLMLSHGDLDHAGGMPAVRRRMAVERTLGLADGPDCVPGDSWQWDGVRFRILHPRPGYWAGNNASCVLAIEGPYRVLLAGDIEAAAEAALLRDAPEQLAADVLLAPHHGSRSSSSAAFIAAVAPRVVIHSAGWRSRFGHPHPQVVARYAEAGALQWTTGVSGAIVIDASRLADGDIAGHRARAPRWWRADDAP